MHPRIHLSKIWKIMEQTDSKGKALPFSFQYAKKNGELLSYHNATLSSIFSKGATFISLWQEKVNVEPLRLKFPVDKVI